MSSSTVLDRKDTAHNVPEERTDTLRAIDRCDACGSAQAYVRATLSTGTLQFCAHHAKAYEAKVRPLATVWLDERWKLAENK